MNKIQMIKKVVIRKAGRGDLVLRKYSPEILMGVGIVGIVGSTMLACKATLKVENLIDESQEKVDKIREAKEKFDEEKYSEQDYKRDLAVVYVQTSVDFIKLYGPAVTLGVASIGCVLGAQGIMRKRNLALVAAYKAVEQSFADYRKRVVEEFGEKKDYDFKNGIRQTEVTEPAYTDENGKKHKAETKKVDVLDPNGISQYARFFDESCVAWNKIPGYNFAFLKAQQNFANDLLHSRGHLFLNEVYEMLGIPHSQAGAVVGWIEGEGDNFVDFGIFDSADGAKRDFVNGYERNILLDFNVAGVIYDMI